MTLGSPPQSPVSGGFYNSPALSSLSISSPTHQQQHQYQYQQQQQPQQHGYFQQQQQQPPPQYGGGTPQNQSGYLPGFLMGDPSMQSPSTPGPGHRPLVSPNKLNRSLSTHTPAPGHSSSAGTPATPLPGPSLRGPQLLKENMNSSLSRSVREKPGGPPTNSLLFTPNRSISTPGTGGSLGASLLSPPGAPDTSTCQSQEVLTSPDPTPLDTWITVWGFPPSAVSFILSELSVCGTVLQHIIHPNSNWMHVRMQTRMQANKAVAKNGAVMGGSIMIGITHCKDNSVLESAQHSILESSVNTSVANLSSTLGGTPRTIRPLTQAYKEAQEENKVVPGTNTPTRSNGIVSRAMGCVFGW